MAAYGSSGYGSQAPVGAATGGVPQVRQQVYAANATGATTQTVTLPASVAAGNGLVAIIYEFPATASVTAVSGGGAAWTQVLRNSNGGNMAMSVWVGRNTSAGTSITVTSNANQTNEVSLSEWTGLSTTSTAYTSATSQNTTQTTLVTGSVTPATIGDLVIGGLETNTTPTLTYTDTPGPWTNLAGNADFMPAYRIATSLTSHSRSASASVSANYIGIAVVIPVQVVVPSVNPVTTLPTSDFAYGYFDTTAVVPITATPIKTTTVRVSIYTPDGVSLICHVPRRSGVQWLNELNTPGTGQFELHMDDPVVTAHPEILNYFNIVKFSVNNVPVKAWVVEAINPTYLDSGEAASRKVTFSGRGVMALLENAVVFPEYGLREFVAEDRNFDFTSVDGEWRNPSEWVTPVGITIAADTTGRKGYPKDWLDTQAQWIWSTNPNANAPIGRNWFRATFTLATATTIAFSATCDNAMMVYLDGSPILASDPTAKDAAFKTTFKSVQTLASGDHTIAAWVDNFAITATSANPTGLNPAGFLFTAYKTDSAGNATSINVLRSNPATFKVKSYGSAPGFTGAGILTQLINEARDRNVRGLTDILWDFDSKLDSAGFAWPDVQNRSAKVGTTDLLDLATQLIELGMDIDISPGLVLRAWRERGSNLSGQVTIRPYRDLSAETATRSAGKVKNHALLFSESGWLEIFNSASKEDYGRREVGLSVGTANSVDQMILVGAAALREVSRPDITVPVSYTSVQGPQPFVHYDVGDVISTPNEWGIQAPGRVMSIAGSEEDTYVSWNIDVYPVSTDDKIDSATVATGGEKGNASELYASEVLSDSPWGYWRQQQSSGTTLFDASGNQRNLQLIGPATGYQLAYPGPIETSVAWTGGVQTRARSSSTFAFKYATLEAWIYFIAAPAANIGILTMSVDSNSGTNAQFDKTLYLMPGGKVSFYAYASTTSNAVITTPSALAVNTWHHIAAVVGAAGMYLYLNGHLVAQNSTVKSSFSSPQYVTSRGGPTGYDNRGAIRIAEPAVYYQALTASRIASHFAAASALT